MKNQTIEEAVKGIKESFQKIIGDAHVPPLSPDSLTDALVILYRRCVSRRSESKSVAIDNMRDRMHTAIDAVNSLWPRAMDGSKAMILHQLVEVMTGVKLGWLGLPSFGSIKGRDFGPRVTCVGETSIFGWTGSESLAIVMASWKSALYMAADDFDYFHFGYDTKMSDEIHIPFKWNGKWYMYHESDMRFSDSLCHRNYWGLIFYDDDKESLIHTVHPTENLPYDMQRYIESLKATWKGISVAYDTEGIHIEVENFRLPLEIDVMELIPSMDEIPVGHPPEKDYAKYNEPSGDWVEAFEELKLAARKK